MPKMDLLPDAQKIWDRIPPEFQNKILETVYCGSCKKAVKIVNFTGEDMSGGGLLLKGSCAQCKGKVTRYIDPLEDQQPTDRYHGSVQWKVFHESGCPYFNCKHCTKVFSSRVEAIQAEYKPCALCDP